MLELLHADAAHDTSCSRGCLLQGLAAEVEAIQALVVSQETAAGLGPINEDRGERGFTPLKVQWCTS